MYKHACVCVCLSVCLCASVCICVHASVCICIYVCLYISVSLDVPVHVCVYLCVTVSVYICGVPNIKFVSLACIPIEPKVQMWNSICIWVCVCLYVHVFVCTYICVCVCHLWKHLKIRNFKNIVCSCIISSLYVSPIQVHNWDKYKSTKLNYIDRRGTKRNLLNGHHFKIYATITKYFICKY